MRAGLIGLALLFLGVAPVFGADSDAPSPFIYAQSALAPAPSRGWVALLPGEGELSFAASQAHYEKIALLLNANGFDTLIVPYEEAYDEDLDGDVDEDGERIAAVTARAVRWMKSVHPDAQDMPGAVVAWGEGAQGLWRLVATGSKYPLPNLETCVAFYPSVNAEAPFNSRVPMLVQIGKQDDTRALRRYLDTREPGSVEPDVEVHDGVGHGFDVERFATPKTVRSMPLIGTPVIFAYNGAAAREAGQRMLTFLKARLEAPE